jgi:rhodanese-related sulfurtransferase/DNA-binding transcriptional ArsR family regulator
VSSQGAKEGLKGGSRQASQQGPKQVLFAQFAAIAKTLGHPHRLELLEQLAQGERSVETLAQRTRLSVANASQHLQHMRRAGLVANRREGKFIYYRLNDDAVLDLMAALRRIAERNSAEVERVIRSYFDKRDSLEAVSRDELVQRARAGAVTILDVRPEDEFALGHLPNALNIPLRELEARLGEIDPKSEVVAYCRGPYCVLSYEAVAQLRLRGFNARRLEDGLPEWRAAGLPVATGNA